jgi:hypothetical protein
MPTLRERLNDQLFDKWTLGAPKTNKFVLLTSSHTNSKQMLSTREQHILDWHYLRMKAWGLAIPALFLASIKPVLQWPMSLT